MSFYLELTNCIIHFIHVLFVFPTFFHKWQLYKNKSTCNILWFSFCLLQIWSYTQYVYSIYRYLLIKSDTLKTAVGLLVHRKQGMWPFQNRFTWENKANISATIKQVEKQTHAQIITAVTLQLFFFSSNTSSIKLVKYYASKLNLFSSILCYFQRERKKKNKAMRQTWWNPL